jgi:O-antigen/teichoic acid export membrane protein
VLGLKNFKLFSLSLFLGSTLPAVFAVLLSSFGIFYMTLGWGIGFIVSSIPNILYLFRKRIFSGYRKVDVKKLFFRFSLPIFPIELTGALFGSIVPLLSLFFSQKLISYYSFAFMFYWAAQLVPNSLSSVMFPTISGLSDLGRHENAKGILRKAFLYYGLFAVIGFIFALLFSDWFIGIVASDYLPSLYMFKIIVSLSFLFGFNIIYATYLKGLGKVKKYALFVLAQNILLLVISFIILST